MSRSRRLSRLTRVVAGLAAGVTIAGVPWSSPGAQGRAPIAIVGARLVDGSGNEPFTGTIVFAAGRITAVGRQVDVPADAQRIDGTGKTVLPGAIDAGLGPDAPLAGEGGTRRLGRALAAGITTAATIDAPPVTSGDPIAPRLLAQPRDGGDAAAAPGSRVLRNGTIAIALDGDARAASVAARTAKARLALAGLTGADGSIDAARIAATGLAPLEAVTAMTSGGAWALGLQSDRGLLAPGMRADLVVVAGDPTASLDALAAVERVYLGGVEIDRAALLRLPEAPIAPPPTPTAASPAPTTAAAPAPLLGGRGRRPKNARLEPIPTSRPVSPELGPVPSAAPAPSPATSTSATPEPSVAAPAPAAPAPAAAAPVIGERLRDALLDDFERGDTVSAIGPPWTGSGNDAATTIIMGRVVKGLRDHALLVSARMGTAHDPFARVALKLATGDRPVDVSRFRGLRFDARGEGRYRVVFVTRGVADGRYHESYFSGSPLWTPVNIPFASVGQTGPGEHVAWTGRDLIEVRFEIARDAGRLGWLELDNVTLY